MVQEHLDSLLRRHSSPATTLLGTRLLDVDEASGTAKFSFLARPEFANVLGQTQGGIVAAMLDEAAGVTARLVAEEELSVPTLDFRVTFIKPAKLGLLFATARCLRLGRRVGFLEADLHTLEGDLLSRMSVTALAVRSSGAASDAEASTRPRHQI